MGREIIILTLGCVMKENCTDNHLKNITWYKNSKLLQEKRME